MKRLLLAAAVLLLGSVAYAVIPVVPTPIVPPNETGEDSLHQGEVFNMARLKIGQCTATASGAEATQTATCNGGSGIVTSNGNITVVSNAVDVFTITNNKVQAGDGCFAMLDDTGAAAASIAEVQSCRVSANTLVIRVTNGSATSPAASAKIMFLVLTKGNSN